MVVVVEPHGSMKGAVVSGLSDVVCRASSTQTPYLILIIIVVLFIRVIVVWRRCLLILGARFYGCGIHAHPINRDGGEQWRWRWRLPAIGMPPHGARVRGGDAIRHEERDGLTTRVASTDLVEH